MENNIPQGTKIETVEKEGHPFYTISYISEETTDTPFGVMPVMSFSTGNFDQQVAVDTFAQTLEANGYNFKTKLWQ